MRQKIGRGRSPHGVPTRVAQIVAARSAVVETVYGLNVRTAVVAAGCASLVLGRAAVEVHHLMAIDAVTGCEFRRDGLRTFI